MTNIELSGRLICSTSRQADAVAEHLALHTELSRAEEGCIEFFVRPTTDPLIWEVSELFSGQEAFDAHQRRVQSSAWGSATAGIERQYSIRTVED